MGRRTSSGPRTRSPPSDSPRSAPTPTPSTERSPSASASALRRPTIRGGRLMESAELLAYASDVHSPDVNEVVRARFGAGEAADAAIDATITMFAGRPFLWWVGEDDTPADLSRRLDRHG